MTLSSIEKIENAKGFDNCTKPNNYSIFEKKYLKVLTII